MTTRASNGLSIDIKHKFMISPWRWWWWEMGTNEIILYKEVLVPSKH